MLGLGAERAPHEAEALLAAVVGVVRMWGEAPEGWAGRVVAGVGAVEAAHEGGPPQLAEPAGLAALVRVGLLERRARLGVVPGQPRGHLGPDVCDPLREAAAHAKHALGGSVRRTTDPGRVDRLGFDSVFGRWGARAPGIAAQVGYVPQRGQVPLRNRRQATSYPATVAGRVVEALVRGRAPLLATGEVPTRQPTPVGPDLLPGDLVFANVEARDLDLAEVARDRDQGLPRGDPAHSRAVCFVEVIAGAVGRLEALEEGRGIGEL